MRLREVHNTAGCRFYCKSCGRIIQERPVSHLSQDSHVQGKVWADMDGKPYEEYYCDSCMTQLTENCQEVTLYAIRNPYDQKVYGPFQMWGEAFSFSRAHIYYGPVRGGPDTEELDRKAKESIIEVKEYVA